MPTRHNLRDYEEAGLEARHVPVESLGAVGDALDDLVRLLRRELRRRGAVAIHANRHTDLPDAVCLQVLDVGVAPIGPVAASAAARPLERAQLARARPPDSLGRVHVTRSPVTT